MTNEQRAVVEVADRWCTCCLRETHYQFDVVNLRRWAELLLVVL
jgi:hypothetical protein